MIAVGVAGSIILMEVKTFSAKKASNQEEAYYKNRLSGSKMWVQMMVRGDNLIKLKFVALKLF